MVSMSRKSLVVGAAITLVFLLVFWIVRPHGDVWTPAFLADATQVPASTDIGISHPFIRKLGPNSFQVLDNKGVTWRDYELDLDFDTVVRLVQSECLPGTGWEDFVTSDTPTPTMKATEADRRFLKGNRAITVYRKKHGNKTLVRVWTRTPGLFGGFLGH